MNRFFRARGVAAAGVAVGACAAALAALGALGANGASPRTGPLAVRGSLERPPAAFVRGDGIYEANGRSQLGGAVSGAMMGPLSSVAVRSPDGASVAYNTWQDARPVDNSRSFSAQGIHDGDVLGVPSLRVHDNRGGDVLLARGAYSAAWRDDGAIAFVEGTDASFRAGRVYEGDVVVRPGVHGRDLVWTRTADHYVVYAWARNRLLFYRIGLGERLELLVADAAGEIRKLADGSAVAVSPDATRVAVVSQDGTNVRVLDIASGRELSWLDVTTAGPPLRWIAYSGAWTRDHIVAPASTGLAVLHVGDGSLSVEQALSLDRSEFPAGVQEPRFTDSNGNEIAAVADVPPAAGSEGTSFLLQCDRIARTCERGPSAPAKDWLRLVDQEGRR